MKNVEQPTPTYNQDKSQPTSSGQSIEEGVNTPSIDPNSEGPQLDGDVIESEPQSVNATGSQPGEKGAFGWQENSVSSSIEEEE